MAELHIDRSVAIRYGMPNIGCHYTRDDVAATAPDDDWVGCVVCGKTAHQCHHEPPRSVSRAAVGAKTMNGALLLETPNGTHVLKPALIALCRECHAKRHNGDIRIEWVFDREEYEQRWLDGSMLSSPATVGTGLYLEPHSIHLYGFGSWKITDKTTGYRYEYRGGGY